jgi:hypothetical protein
MGWTQSLPERAIGFHAPKETKIPRGNQGRAAAGVPDARLARWGGGAGVPDARLTLWGGGPLGCARRTLRTGPCSYERNAG